MLRLQRYKKTANVGLYIPIKFIKTAEYAYILLISANTAFRTKVNYISSKCLRALRMPSSSTEVVI